ncbi:methylated-DNA--[protein]-cysteine S-methyltransferase [Alkalibacillus haloalkaliphilus]|uniref:methylated-DNA--[protein]-cysteine S-methyltransferase n=1 Tax=Alkalibacillus haloalkaliphilus TaxID=94136 RepID=A0A511W8Q8_9BACI|nr:methylated-DNA--[protein]-cysteine S-methyltransferase [Alkalibacillus haloalkaliphilus]GEN47111.1 methylated-DNA--protein-cysteine methyltransferase [Alkalibacillus haloalkaliphilus]
MGEMKITTYQSPIGALIIGSRLDCLYFIEHMKDDNSTDWLNRRKNTFNQYEMVQGCSFNGSVIEQLERYFNQESLSEEIPMELVGTDFQKSVWNALIQVPYGQTVKYQEIAKAINNPKAVRAVGGAINKNPVSILIPCHRVIGSNGSLVGYEGGLERKKALLTLETNDEKWLKIN